MRSVKVMLLGIGLILVGIFFRLWSISYVYSEFVVHHLPIAAVAAGVIALAAGMFFVEDGEGWQRFYSDCERKRGMGFCCMTCICIPVFRPAPRTI